jgi:F-type H+-transporting ATPase subunit gamma
MNMVAAAKLRATQGTAERFHNYADEHGRLLEEIGKRSRNQISSFIKPSENQDKVLLVVFSSDRGLCGSYNSNIFYHTDRAILDVVKKGAQPVLYIFGKKGREYYKRRAYSCRSTDKLPQFNHPFASRLAKDFIKEYATDYSEIQIIYTRFENVNKRPVVTIPFLPLAPEEKKESKEVALEGEGRAPALAKVDYLMEPEADELLKYLIPESLAIKLHRCYLESVTSENAARMQAMDNASKSCKDIIDTLTLSYNKARQSAVTNELLDIVNGAEALKG